MGLYCVQRISYYKTCLFFFSLNNCFHCIVVVFFFASNIHNVIDFLLLWKQQRLKLTVPSALQEHLRLLFILQRQN